MIIKTKDRTQALARIEDILDPGSFMEIGEHITAHLTSFYDPGEVTESDGVITGYGTVDSHLVFIFSQDAEVMGGTFGEMHGRKIKDLYARALKAKAPVIGIMDCKGFRIEEGLDGLDIFASLYAMQARAAERIPQIIAVVGDCGGGMSLSAVMADFVFIEKEKGNIFVNSQNLVENDLGGSGYISAFDDGRYDWAEIVGNVQALIRLLPPSADYDPLPAAVTDDLNRPCLAMAEHAGDARYIIREIADDHYFFEAQPDKAEDLVTGFIRLAGWPVGVVACNEVDGENRITSAGCDKATSIVNLCRKFNLPLLTITDTEGYKTTEENEKYLPNAAGRLIKALTALTTPKVNLIVDYAVCCFRLGDTDKAVRKLEELYRKGPNGLIYQTLGYLYVEQYDARGKAAFLARETEAQEQEDPALTMLAEAEGEAQPQTLEEKWEAGRQKALSFNQEAVDYDDEDPICLDNLGQTWYRVMDDPAEAKTWFEKAHEAKPEQIDTLYFLSRYDLEAGDTAAAVSKLEKAAEGKFSPLNYCSKEKIEEEIKALKEAGSIHG